MTRHHSMSDREAYRHLRPKTRRDQLQLRKLLGYLALIAIGVITLLVTKHWVQLNRERNWNSAVATIEDVKTDLVTQNNSEFGGAMFYGVQVLVSYPVDGNPRRRWITVSQRPKLLADAQLEAFRWKGRTCIVRWKPSDPDHPVAEVS